MSEEQGQQEEIQYVESGITNEIVEDEVKHDKK